MPDVPPGFILVSGSMYFNPATGTYWNAPSSAPVSVSTPAPTTLSSSPFERPVISYPMTRTEISTGKVEYATPSGGWTSKDPGMITTYPESRPTPAPSFTREASPAPPKPTPREESFARIEQSTLRPEVVQFIETNYEGHLAYAPPGTKGHEDYMRVYNQLAPGIPEPAPSTKYWNPFTGEYVANKTEAEKFTNKQGFLLEDVKEFSTIKDTGEIAGFTTKAGIVIVSGEVAGKYNLKSEKDYYEGKTDEFGLPKPRSPFPVLVEYKTETPKLTGTDMVLAANAAAWGTSKSIEAAQAEKMMGGSQFGIGAGAIGAKAAKDLFGRHELTVSLPGVSESKEYFVKPGLPPGTNFAGALGLTLGTDEGRGAVGRAVTTTAFTVTEGVGSLVGTMIDVPVQLARDAPGAVSYVKEHPTEAALLGGTAFVLGAGGTIVGMGQDVATAAQGDPRALGRTGLNVAMLSVPVLPRIGKALGTSGIELVKPGRAGLAVVQQGAKGGYAYVGKSTEYGIFKSSEVTRSPVGSLYNRPLANVKAPQVVSTVAEKVWNFPEKVTVSGEVSPIKAFQNPSQVNYYANPVAKLGAGGGTPGGALSKGVVSIGKVPGLKEDTGSYVPAGYKPSTLVKSPTSISEYMETHGYLPETQTTELKMVGGKPIGYSPLGGKAYDFKGTLLEDRAVGLKITVDKPSSLKQIGLGGDRLKLDYNAPNPKTSEPFTSFRTKTTMSEQRTFTETELGTGNPTTSKTAYGTRTIETEVKYAPTPYKYKYGQELPRLEQEGLIQVSSGNVPLKIDAIGEGKVTLGGSKQIGQGLTKSQKAFPTSRAELDSFVSETGKTTSYYQEKPSVILQKGARIEDYLGRGGQFTISGKLGEAQFSVTKTGKGIERLTFETPRTEPSMDYLPKNKRGGSAKVTGSSGEGLKNIELEGGGTVEIGGGQTTSLKEVSFTAGKQTMLGKTMTLHPITQTTTTVSTPITSSMSITAPPISLSKQRTGVVEKSTGIQIEQTKTIPLAISLEKSVSLTRAVPLEKTISLESTIPRTISLERAIPIEKAVSLEKSITLERTIPRTISLERAIPIEKAVSLEKSITLERTLQQELTKQKTTELTRQVEINIPVPTIPKFPTSQETKPTKPKPPPPDTFPILFPGGKPRKESNRAFSGASLKKFGKFGFKGKLQPLLQPFEQLRTELRTGKPTTAYIPSTPKTRAIYAKNMFGAFGKSGLEGMFNTKRRRKK